MGTFSHRKSPKGNNAMSCLVPFDLVVSLTIKPEKDLCLPGHPARYTSQRLISLVEYNWCLILSVPGSCPIVGEQKALKIVRENWERQQQRQKWVGMLIVSFYRQFFHQWRLMWLHYTDILISCCRHSTDPAQYYYNNSQSTFTQ